MCPCGLCESHLETGYSGMNASSDPQPSAPTESSTKPPSKPASESSERVFTHAVLRWGLPWPALLLSAVLAPIAIIVGVTHPSSLAAFILNAAALAPTAALLRRAIHDFVWWLQALPPHINHGHQLGGLVECLLGSSPEMIFSAVALHRREVLIVQTSITGSLLSNSLLVLGSCLLLGALKSDMDLKSFDIVLTRATLQMLMIALGSIVMPAAWVSWSNGPTAALLPVSHGAAIVLLILYACYFWFLYGSHDWLMHKGAIKKGILLPAMMAIDHVKPSLSNRLAKHTKERIAGRKAKLHPLMAIIFSVGGGVSLSLCTFYALQNIDRPLEQWSMSKSFLGLVVFPVLMGAFDHTIAAVHATRQEMDWTIRATMVSNIRVALFVLPVAICVGWGLNIQDMTLSFDGFQIALVFMAVLIVNQIFRGEGGHWLDGAMLLSMYGLLVDTAWFYPNDA